MNFKTDSTSLRLVALHAFNAMEADDKLAAVNRLAPEAMAAVQANGIDTPASDAVLRDTSQRAAAPGRPPRPELIPATQVPRRRINSPQGRAAMVHAICHIEFNAINLALDAVWRFDAMPEQYYLDWARVAREEAYHFSLLRQHLRSIGHEYGDFPAHNGLWEMAENTREDLLARLALVPRFLEARGLDASPVVRAKFVQAKDLEGAAILDIILRDEIGHVSVGNYWYRWVCAQRGLDPLAQFPALCAQYRAPRLIGPFNMEARLAAGFVTEELDAMTALAARRD